jgi:Methyltransferase domain
VSLFYLAGRNNRVTLDLLQYRDRVSNLKYLRLKLFHKVITLAQPAARGRRMARFEEIFALPPGTRIIDLGGTSEIWNLVRTPLDITIVNLPGADARKKSLKSHHRFTFVEGDATRLHEYADNSFDIVFSNSVIEHVGGEENERKFASETRRLAPSYFVQTPSVYFPIEVHTGMPFWWIIPRFIRARVHKRWEKTLPAWNEMIAGTTVLSRHQLQSYFQDGTMGTERVLGIPKSYYVYRVAGSRT